MSNSVLTNLKFLWASLGAITDPDASDALRPNYQQGWLSEIPTLQEFNYLLNALDNNILNIAEHGRFAYDADIDYDECAMVSSGARTFYSKSNGNQGNDVFDKNRWVMGFTFGDMGMSAYSNVQGLLLSNIGGYTSNTLWEGNDLHIKSALPIVSFQSTNSTDNWLLGNIEGEMCVVNKGGTGLPNNSSLAKSESYVHRLYHEGHVPTQGEVPGTIPDAPANGNSFVRNDNQWVTADTGLGDAPSDNLQYARKNAAWVEVEDAAQVGDMRVSGQSVAKMAARKYAPCDGTTIDRAAPYDKLYAEVGDIYGDGNGATTFNKPNIPPLLEGTRGDLDGFQLSTTTNYTNAYSIARDPVNGDLWLTKAGDTGLYYCAGGIGAFTQIYTLGDHSFIITYCSFDGKLYAMRRGGGTATGMYVSGDRGASWSTHLASSYHYAAMGVDNSNGDLWVVEVVAPGVRIYKQSGGVGALEQLASPGASVVVREIAIDSTSGNVYLLTSSYLTQLPGGQGAVWVVKTSMDGVSGLAIDEGKQLLYYGRYNALLGQHLVRELKLSDNSTRSVISNAQPMGMVMDQESGTLRVATNSVNVDNRLYASTQLAPTDSTQWYIKY